MTTTRTSAARLRRGLLAVAVTTAMAGGGLLVSAGPAGAEPGGWFHDCDPFAGLRPPDDGPLGDVVHHNVEPVIAPYTGGPAAAHELSCGTVAYVDFLVENFTTGGALQGIVGCLVPNLLGQPCVG